MLIVRMPQAVAYLKATRGFTQQGASVCAFRSLSSSSPSTTPLAPHSFCLRLQVTQRLPGQRILGAEPLPQARFNPGVISLKGKRGIVCSAQAMAASSPPAPPVEAPDGGAGATSGGSVRAQVAALFAEALEKVFPDEDITPIVASCNNPKFGDYQCNNAMPLFAKVKGQSTEFKNPRSIGEAIMKALPASPLIGSTSIAGPGFVNIKLSQPWVEDRLIQVVKDGVDTWAPKLPYDRVVVDYSAPNIAKEMHVGHLRSTIIGECIARMLDYCGCEVLRRNHVGDWGTQFGMLIQYLFDQGPEATKDMQHAIGDLQTFYKASKVRFDEDKDFKLRSQQAVVKLQSGDPESRAAWEQICEISRREFLQVYKRLGVTIEEKGESFYNPYIPDVLKMLEEKGLTTISDGATCIFLPGKEVPMIIKKSDGGFNYSSTDMTALWYRLHVEKGDWIIYVTDVGQGVHFANVFEAGRMMGWLPQEGGKQEGMRPKPRVDHVGFGLVLGKDGKRYRTRSTEVERLVDLLDEAKNRCREQLKERGKEDEWSEEELERAAEAVGYGAVKYADLHQNRLTNYTFSYDRMLDLKGNTAVYLMYALARIFAIMRKSGANIDELKKTGSIKLGHAKEQALGLHLIRFSEVVEGAVNDLLPNQLCEYLYQCSELFNEFYTECRVVGSPEETSRLLLCDATAEVMKQCLQLLGINALERL